MEQRDPNVTPRYYLRVDLFPRLLHGLLMGSFLGLAATGLPLKFSWAPRAGDLARAMGGFGTILFFHKAFAILLTLCFLLHLGYVLHLAS